MKTNIKTTDFFNSLYNNSEGYIEIRAISNNKKSIFIKTSDLGLKIDKVIEEFNEKYNCYFGVALRGINNNGKKENCTVLTALFVDIDYGKEGHKKESIFPDYDTAFNLIEKYPIKPTFIVHTGHGFQLYWKLKDPVNLNSESIPQIEGILKQLSLSIGGDFTHNIDRIFRIPGTLNIKTENHVPCTIFEYNEKNVYTLDEIKNHPIFEVQFDKIYKDSKLMRYIFGIVDKDIDRSQYDEKIIYQLLTKGLSENEIKIIFNYYPTTGKYLERMANDPKGANSYLNHSIEKAINYYSSNITNPELLRKCTLNNDNEEPENTKIIYLDNKHYLNIDNNKTGYYEINQDGDSRLTNFLIIIEEQIKDSIKHDGEIFYNLVIDLGTEKIKVKNVDPNALSTSQRIIEFVNKYCGTKALIFNQKNILPNLIKIHNQSAKTYELLEFGYNEDLSAYYTPNLKIDKNGIYPCENKILESDSDVIKNLDFPYNQFNINDAIDKLNDIVEAYESNEILAAIGSFALPIVYPFTNANQKPYIVFLGPSGCGKTTMLKFINSFYSTSKTLKSWTSTITSLEVIGNQSKDVVFAVDDLKAQNFPDDSAIRRFMSCLQNYADGTSRSRANVDLSIKDDTIIRGILIISGEDVVVKESSTAARGIRVFMLVKNPNFQLIQKIESQYSYYRGITPYFIKYVLRNKDKISSIYNDCITQLSDYASTKNYSGANVPRLINNLSLIITAYKMFYMFLSEYEKQEILNSVESNYQNISIELFDYNYSLIEEKKPEEKYLTTVLELISIQKDHIIDIDNPEKQISPKTIPLIALSKNDINKTYQVLFFGRGFDYVDEYLRPKGGIGCEYSTVVETLYQQGKCYKKSSNRLNFGLNNITKTYYGFILTEEIDGLKDAIGIPADYKLVIGKRESKMFSSNEESKENKQMNNSIF